ncbi:AAA family ATPase [Halorhodospira sp. 9621]|uniref:ATP-dependent nuclease n=1 Tax=Halorhodospira sp. 9621 TaxID=2899135 RepID=UPI001EE917D7|nr:AAA family ATPase [Halorhodospira sp. 9621]MCG5534017.1 AAA family ATPase [Halorhodospira sp. 9621]
MKRFRPSRRLLRLILETSKTSLKMFIESVTLSNFKSFGPEPTTTTLSPHVITLVGTNGSGKTALIEALQRLFSPVRGERAIQKSDFHFAPDETEEQIDKRWLYIEATLAFPEIDNQDTTEGAKRTVPAAFNDMFITQSDGSLKARIRLEAQWRRNESFEDDVDADIYWILSDSCEIYPGDEHPDKMRFKAADKALIQLRYIPAARHGGNVSRTALKQLLARLERTADWDETTKNRSFEQAAALERELNSNSAINHVTKMLSSEWQHLHRGNFDGQPRFSVVARQFEKLIRELTVSFEPGPGGRDRDLEELSEGQSSLFYFALAVTLYKLEQELAYAEPGEEPEGFTQLDYDPPTLTIFVLEEPENHLAPFYLPRLMSVLQHISAGEQAMALVTSHSPSILRRSEPENVRHLHIKEPARGTVVNQILLPESDQAAYRFIREALIANPELYFANACVLGEGESEEIVLPRLAEAQGVSLDPSFVAFVPLRSRYAGHLWRLLAQLQIPHLTLLDFDLGRCQAGPKRLKDALRWLREHRDARLSPPRNEQELDDLISQSDEHDNNLDHNALKKWIEWFEEQNVYFSYPLDLDFAMIRAFPEAYNVSTEEPDQDEKHAILRSIFHGSGVGLPAYNGLPEEEQVSFRQLRAYRTLFKSRSKPASHYAGIGCLSTDTMRDGCPPELKRLVRKLDAYIADTAWPSETGGKE